MSTTTQTATQTAPADLHKPFGMKKSWGWILTSGVLMMILGCISLSIPVATGLAATMTLSILLLVTSGAQIAQAFITHRQPGFFLALFTKILAVLTGIVLFKNPLAELITLRTITTIYFLISGIFRMVMAFELKPVKGWGFTLFGGIVTTLMAIYLFTLLPLSSMWIVGIVLGVDLMFWGIAQIFQTIHIRQFETTI